MPREDLEQRTGEYFAALQQARFLAAGCPARMPRPRAVIEEPASLLDLTKTLLDVAGIRPEAKFDGISLVPALASGKVEEQRTLLFFGSDPRWIGYWSEFRIARFRNLPQAVGDMQLFTVPA